jgi:hypothetical protein
MANSSRYLFELTLVQSEVATLMLLRDMSICSNFDLQRSRLELYHEGKQNVVIFCELKEEKH